jgi:hypothetical protein
MRSDSNCERDSKSVEVALATTHLVCFTLLQLGSGTSELLDDMEAVFAGLDPAAPSAEVHAAPREKLSAPLYRTQ